LLELVFPIVLRVQDGGIEPSSVSAWAEL
jgi:hypothetical protein